MSQNGGCFKVLLSGLKTSKIKFTILTIIVFSVFFNFSRWFEMETFEAFDEEYNETIAILQVRKNFQRLLKITYNIYLMDSYCLILSLYGNFIYCSLLSDDDTLVITVDVLMSLTQLVTAAVLSVWCQHWCRSIRDQVWTDVSFELSSQHQPTASPFVDISATTQSL